MYKYTKSVFFYFCVFMIYEVKLLVKKNKFIYNKCCVRNRFLYKLLRAQVQVIEKY